MYPEACKIPVKAPTISVAIDQLLVLRRVHMKKRHTRKVTMKPKKVSSRRAKQGFLTIVPTEIAFSIKKRLNTHLHRTKKKQKQNMFTFVNIPTSVWTRTFISIPFWIFGWTVPLRPTWEWDTEAGGELLTGPCDRKHEQKTAWHSRSISCFWRFQGPRLRHSAAQNKLVRKCQNMSARLRQFLEICQNTSRGPNTNRNSSLNSYIWRGIGSLIGAHLVLCANQLDRAAQIRRERNCLV